jgi:hypothetical protein
MKHLAALVLLTAVNANEGNWDLLLIHPDNSPTTLVSGLSEETCETLKDALSKWMSSDTQRLECLEW